MAQREDNLNTKINRELKQLLDKKGIAADKIVVFGSYARKKQGVRQECC